MKIVLHSSSLVKDVLKFSTKTKLGALDVGKNFVGIAMSDESRTFVKPLGCLERQTNQRMSATAIDNFSSKLERYVCENKIAGFVVGLPIFQGELTPFCNEIIKLMTNVQLPEKPEVFCTFWNETDSTFQARNLSSKYSTSSAVYLRQKDALAAGIILMDFMNEKKGKHF